MKHNKVAIFATLALASGLALTQGIFAAEQKPNLAPPNPIPPPGSVQLPKTPPPPPPPPPKIEGPKVGPGRIEPTFNPPGVKYTIPIK